MNLCFPQSGVGFKKDWTFFATSHAESLCDSIKETVKRLVGHENLQCPFARSNFAAPINSRLNVVVRAPPHLGWVEMAVDLPEGPHYPGDSPLFFLPCCPLNNCRRAAHSFSKIGRLSSSPHSFPSLDEQ